MTLIAILFVVVVVVVVLIFVTPNKKKVLLSSAEIPNQKRTQVKSKEHKYKKQKALFTLAETLAETPAEISFTKSLNKIVANRDLIVYGKYKKQKALFSPTEINFKKSLNKIVVNQNLIVYGKVRIADIITPAINQKDNYKKWLSAFAQIQSKHVDYVICDERDYSVLCVIELDDSSHNTTKAKKRDALVNQAYQSAGVEIVRVKAARNYLLKELLDLFSDDMQHQLSQEQ
jgi:hypothetical protein